MKVLFLSNLFPDSRENYRGLDNATLLHHLSEDCEIRAMSPRPALPFSVVVAKEPREIDQVFQPTYPRVAYVPKIGSHFNHHLFAAGIRKPLLELREEFPFDLILVSWTFPDTAAVAKLQGELGVPFVAIVQGSDAHVYLQMPPRRKVIVRTLNQSAGAITRSGKLAAMLQEAGVAGEKLHPIYNGVDLEMFAPGDSRLARLELGLSTSKPILLFVGNFFPIKNPLLLIRAHAQLCREFPKLESQLVMIGGGPLEAEARELANQLGSGANVLVAGRRKAPEIAEYMRAADLLCVPSDNEGVPNVVLEAFASGLKIVSTDVGGISEVLCDDLLGRLTPAGDQDAFVKALAASLTEPTDRNSIRAYGTNFSWKRSSDAYKAVMERAVGASPD
jgi:teichuronic acid biosynthesis glycosyltransferase TuaC